MKFSFVTPAYNSEDYIEMMLDSIPKEYAYDAGVMELVDVVDSKSTASDGVPVRVRPPAP